MEPLEKISVQIYVDKCWGKYFWLARAYGIIIRSAWDYSSTDSLKRACPKYLNPMGLEPVFKAGIREVD